MSELMLNLSQDLCNQGYEDRALDHIYDTVDNLLKLGEFDTIDAIFINIDTTQYDTVILIALLTTTKPAKSKLQHYDDLFHKVKKEILNREGDIGDLLIGLD